MPTNDAQRLTFEQLINAGLVEIGDGYRAKLSELGGTGLRFLRSGHVTDAGITFDGVERFRKDLDSSFRSKTSRPGDTIVTTKGNSTGRTAYVADEMPQFVYSPHLSYWRSLDHSRVLPGFLRYWAKGPEFAAQLAGMKDSTDMAPYLSLTDQRRLRISLPPPAVQRCVATVLGALDDKIELNRQMNRTLEEMARAIFKSWFVDFDPVVAKAAGRQPFGMSADTAALFPDRFVESELGPIPEGWRVGMLGEIADVNGKIAGPDYPHPEIEYVDISAVSRGRLGPTSRHLWKDAPSRARRQVSNGDTIWSCVRPNRRSYLFIDSPASNLVVSTGFAVLSPSVSSSAFLYLLVTTGDFVEYLTANAEGSAYPAVRPDVFIRAPVVIPPRPLLDEFAQAADPLLTSVVQNEHQSRTLGSLRNLLLPQLLAGEIRVRQVEALVERAGA